MKQHQNIWLPDGEQYLIDSMDEVDGRGTYQIEKWREALKHVKQFRTAVDIGAHCGLWSIQMAQRFSVLHAFEPVAAHQECYRRNLGISDDSDSRVFLHACALGDKEGGVEMVDNLAISCKTRVKGIGEIPMHTLDSFGLKNVDFIKIDTEGYELYVIRGGEETIKRYRPTMIVEQKGHGETYFGLRKEEGVELLESWGMHRVINLSGDWIMVWP